MSKTHQGTCRGCNTIQPVHEVGNVDLDLHTHSPEAAYLVDDHKNGSDRCVGVDLSPIRLYIPQGASKVYGQETGQFEVGPDGDHISVDGDDGWDGDDRYSS